MQDLLSAAEKGPLLQRIRAELLSIVGRVRENKLPVRTILLKGKCPHGFCRFAGLWWPEKQINSTIGCVPNSKIMTIPPLSLSSRVALLARMVHCGTKESNAMVESKEEPVIARRIRLEDVALDILQSLSGIPEAIPAGCSGCGTGKSLSSLVGCNKTTRLTPLCVQDTPAFQLKSLESAVLHTLEDCKENGRFITNPASWRDALVQTANRIVDNKVYQIERPTLSFEDVGGCVEIKRKLSLLSAQWTFDTSAQKLGIKRVGGVMLSGPSGCGKTILAKALAGQGALNLLVIKGSDVFSKYVGESAAADSCDLSLRIGASLAPCLLFFDEIDSLTPARSLERSSAAVDLRVLATLLTELDGVEERSGVYVCGATNRLYHVDAALLRPGRFDVLVEIKVPETAEERLDILRVCTRRMKVHEDVDLVQIAVATAGRTGAFLRTVCQEAAIRALREDMLATCVRMRHFHT